MDLIRRPHGWVEPMPPACECGSTRHMIGWAWCECEGAKHGGHRSWRCYDCDRTTLVDCVSTGATLQVHH